ncbi:MAG: hypothetical protein J2P25_08915 [Nocardiopsaceae bacterium]|nr:hypothetical protein [Nocardiopsaceae bacterium]
MAYPDEDQSASTARFRAFAQSQDDNMPAPWEMKAPRSKVWLLVGIVVAVAIVAAIIAALMIG